MTSDICRRCGKPRTASAHSGLMGTAHPFEPSIPCNAHVGRKFVCPCPPTPGSGAASAAPTFSAMTCEDYDGEVHRG